MTISIATDAVHGGRWTSLHDGRREWLWRHPDPGVRTARHEVADTDGFVDAGGAEECFPTVRGDPDHGATWTRRWVRSVDQPAPARDGAVARTDRCDLGESCLQRTITSSAARTAIDYRIRGAEGFRFIHAVHALVELSPAARIEIAGSPRMRVLDHPTIRQASWPDLGGVDVGRPIPIDGTAYAMIIDCAEVLLVDGPDRLRLGWRVIDGEAPVSLLYWRNLRGWPAGAPYRSIGIEPMIGRTADPTAEPDAAAVLGPSGLLAWQLTLTGC